MNFILTGVTGVLGSHIFYELLQKIHDNNYNGEIVLLLRSKNDKTHTERFEEVFTEKLLPGYLKQIDIERLRFHIFTDQANRRHALLVAAVEQLTDLLHTGVFRVMVAFGFVDADGAARVMDQSKHGRAGWVRRADHIEGERLHHPHDG